MLVVNDNEVNTIHTLLSNDMTVMESLAYGMADTTADENDVIFSLIKMAMAVVPLAGLSLLTTGCHYLASDMKATDAVFKQVMWTSSEQVGMLFLAVLDFFFGSYISF